MFRGVWVAFLLAGTAHADPVRIDSKPGACDLALLQAAVAALAPDTIFDDTARAVIRVEGAADPSVRLSIDDGHGDVRGPRTVTAASCADLIESAALVIAMELPKASPAPPPSAEPEALPEPDEPMAPPRPHRPLAIDVFAGAAATSSGSHEQVLVGTRWRRASHSIAVALRLAGDERIPLGMGEVQVGRTDVALEPCAHVAGIGLCALAGAGVIQGAGDGLLRARSVVSPIAFLGATLAWEHALGARLAVRAHLAADVLLTQTELDVDDMPVWTSSRLEATGGLALLVHFP
jgi:hypothetical protein